MAHIERDKLVLPALLVSSLSTYPPQIVTGMLLVEISQSLDTPLGVTGQLRTAISITALLGSLMVTWFTNRYSYRKLLIAGLAAITLSSILSGLSPSFLALLTAAIITGMGVALTVPMTTTLVGEYYPREERGRVMSLLGVGGGVAFLLGGTVTGFLAQYGGWRLAFLGFGGLIGVFGLVFTLLFLPRSETKSSGESFKNLIKQITGNSGAMKSLGGAFLASTAVMGLYLYSFSFLKEVFLTGTLETGFIYTGTALFFILGSYITSRLIGRLGPRKITAFGLLGLSISTLAYHFMPSLRLSVIAILIGNILEALRFNGNNALSLDRAHSQKGAMMSLHSAATQLGYSVGAGLGGLILIYSNWSLMGIIMSAISCIGALVIISIKES
jgi:DHA1 family inner membrane transport protein